MDSSTPAIPPMTNVTMNPSVQCIGVVNLTRPRYMVKSQLKVFTPVGMAINMVAMPKKRLTPGPAPIVKKWWTQTEKDRTMIAAVA